MCTIQVSRRFLRWFKTANGKQVSLWQSCTHTSAHSSAGCPTGRRMITAVPHAKQRLRTAGSHRYRCRARSVDRPLDSAGCPVTLLAVLSHCWLPFPRCWLPPFSLLAVPFFTAAVLSRCWLTLAYCWMCSHAAGCPSFTLLLLFHGSCPVTLLAAPPSPLAGPLSRQLSCHAAGCTSITAGCSSLTLLAAPFLTIAAPLALPPLCHCWLFSHTTVCPCHAAGRPSLTAALYHC